LKTNRHDAQSAFCATFQSCRLQQYVWLVYVSSELYKGFWASFRVLYLRLWTPEMWSRPRVHKKIRDRD